MIAFTRRAAMLLAAFAFSLSSHAARAQEAEEAAGGPGEHAARAYQLDDANDARRLQREYYAASTFASRAHGKIKPYSGQLVFEQRRRLADGNEINTRAVDMLYRDSHGRTRKDVSVGSRKTVIIVDPVAQVGYMIRPEREDVLRVSGPARAPAPLTTVQPGTTPSPVRNNWVNTKLGDKEMAGLMVTGLRMDGTIPAGADGNAQEIHVSHEMWHSSELGIPIQVRVVDPRSGERTTYYEHVTLEEPGAEVFALPAGYAVHDAPPGQAGL